MNKLFTTMVVIMMVFSLGFAASAADVQQELWRNSTIEKVIRSGKLRVGMSTFIPWAMQSKTGEWVGFEIDVAKKLAEDMGVEIEFVPTKWEGLIPSLLTGKFDLIIAGMTGTPTRALKINFTIPYDYSEVDIVAHKEVAAGFTNAEDFNSPDVTVLTRNGTTAVAAVKRSLPNAELRLFSENGPMVQELLNGNAHAIVSSSPEPAQLASKYPDTLFYIDAG
ncbi:transporter substrate-binding domain-containing protein, partial [candidate division KSB3 bacterium]|nr:transporter substrate-binding domain-containing protein [candidate division KSB3 bacterium]MBD3324532.1 transporter substrate-binding domain-containing protein [candidate division KSB3 bacterium]